MQQWSLAQVSIIALECCFSISDNNKYKKVYDNAWIGTNNCDAWGLLRLDGESTKQCRSWRMLKNPLETQDFGKQMESVKGCVFLYQHQYCKTSTYTQKGNVNYTSTSLNIVEFLMVLAHEEGSILFCLY